MLVGLLPLAGFIWTIGLIANRLLNPIKIERDSGPYKEWLGRITRTLRREANYNTIPSDVVYKGDQKRTPNIIALRDEWNFREKHVRIDLRNDHNTTKATRGQLTHGPCREFQHQYQARHKQRTRVSDRLLVTQHDAHRFTVVESYLASYRHGTELLVIFQIRSIPTLGGPVCFITVAEVGSRCNINDRGVAWDMLVVFGTSSMKKGHHLRVIPCSGRVVIQYLPLVRISRYV